MSDKGEIPDLFSAAEDAEAFAIPDEKLVICSPPRTASTFLCRALTAAGIAKPAEYFGIDPERQIRLRTDLAKTMDQYSIDVDYFNDIICRRCFDGLFATKLQYWQLKRLMRSRLSGKLFDGAKVVYLTRADLSDQMVSQAVANLTQRWGDVGAPTDGATHFSDKQLLDAARAALQFLLLEIRGFEEFFAINNVQPLRIRSEDVAENPVAIVRQLAMFSGRYVKRPQILEEFCAVRKRYDTDRGLKDRMRNVVGAKLRAEDEFIKTHESWPVYRWPLRALKNAQQRRAGRIL